MALNREALDALDQGDLEEAETLLKEALEIDPNCGPAHNNLGKVEFRRGNLYGAAWEFEIAARLMPGRAQPRNNLGLVFEASGQLGKAIEHYRDARRLDAESVEIMGNLARAHVKSGGEDEEILGLLRRLSVEDPRPAWAEWARKELAVRGGAE